MSWHVPIALILQARQGVKSVDHTVAEDHGTRTGSPRFAREARLCYGNDL